ncbi:MAG TPA: M20 family metallopeptidase [Beutenbergiaceae bacterium]|nr:M20 family metallopeptidase [Beutenbergiaceae bacterium]
MSRAEAITDLEATVLDLICADDLVGLAQDLIRAPGQNPPGQEMATAQVLATGARERGLAVESVEVAPGRPNLHITTPGAGSDPGLLLLGHTDVVPVGAGWTEDPFGARADQGRLFGRGATDMKGALAACLVAMGALHRAGAPLSGPVELAALMDEEQEGLGIRHYIADPQRRQHAGCIVAEPTDLQTIVAARGASYVEIDIGGVAAHAGNPADGRNAIYGAAAVVAELERWHHGLAADAHQLVGPATWNVGVIAGGVGGSMVPAHCRISADRRLLPGEDPQVVLAEVTRGLAALDLSDRGLNVAVRMPMSMPGFETAAAEPLVQVSDQALVDAGGPGLALGGWSAACDGGFLARDDGLPVVVLGPGSVTGQAHRPDESVAIADLITAARTYALAALRLLS